MELEKEVTNIMRKFLGNTLLLLFVLSAMVIPFSGTDAAAQKVYKVPVHNEIEKGLYAFLQRSFQEAEEAGANAIFLDLDTPGGFTDAAGKIAQLFEVTDMPIIAFIDNEALSAGAFLALHADRIYMVPTGTMGASQVIESTGNAAGAKAHSAWVANMISAAESSGRNPLYAEAMAEPNIDLPKYRAGKGDLLTLTAKEAEEVRYSDGTVSTFKELLEVTGYADAEVVSTNETFAESIARFVTNPIVVPILLSVASLGIVLELYSPGFGVPGMMGLAALFLFFFGHLVAGLAGYETIILFIIGIGLVIAEFFLPGGIAGIIGSLAIIGSIIMAGGNPLYMGISVLIAIAIAATGMGIIMKFLEKNCIC